MRKIGNIAIVVFLVGFCYILMMLFQPAINTLVATANSTSNWTAHSSFGYAQSALVGWPFWAYLVPVSIGSVAVVGILKGD